MSKKVTKQLSEIIFHTLDKGKDVRLADFMDGIMLCKGLRNGNKAHLALGGASVFITASSGRLGYISSDSPP